MAANPYGAYIAGDPIYGQVKRQANRDLNLALQTQVQRQFQMLTQLGNPAFAKSIFQSNPFAMRQTGTGRNRRTDAAYMGGKIKRQMTPFEVNQLKAIQQASNPETGTSTFAKIGREYNETVSAANNQLNAANLFYSGHRAKTLGDLARGKQFAEAEALYGGQQSMNQILDAIMGARRERRTLLMSAAEQAYQRALAEDYLA